MAISTLTYTNMLGHSKGASMDSDTFSNITARRRGLKVLAGALILGCAVALTACGGSGGPGVQGDASAAASGNWDTVISAAKSEGAVTVYASPNHSDVIFKEFEKVYPGITVKVQRQPTSNLTAQLDQEIGAGVKSADVVFHSETPWFTDRGKQGALAPVQVMPANEAAYGKFKGQFIVPVLRYGYFFGYNSDKGGPVTSIEDLANKAQASGATIGYLDPKASIATSAQYDAWDKEYPGIVDRLMKLPHTVFSSTVPMGQSLAAGEIGYAVGLVPGVLPPLIAQGAKVGESIPTDKAIRGVQTSGAELTNAPHPNAAVLFLNWLMSKDLQQEFNDKQPPMVSYLFPRGSLTFESINQYDPAEWTPDRQHQVIDRWKGLSGN
jgi:iron(III) transport system substrate-binding protein